MTQLQAATTLTLTAVARHNAILRVLEVLEESVEEARGEQR